MTTAVLTRHPTTGAIKVKPVAGSAPTAEDKAAVNKMLTDLLGSAPDDASDFFDDDDWC
jgi:hypothetical protein